MAVRQRHIKLVAGALLEVRERDGGFAEMVIRRRKELACAVRVGRLQDGYMAVTRPRAPPAQ